MLSQEIIQLSRIPEENYHSLIQQALNHALWHYILHFDEDDDIEKSLLCLLNESLAELLFRFFCIQNKLPVDFKSQNGDRFLSFTLEDKSWELINLSINGSSIRMSTDAISLPAMIPTQKFDCSQKDDFGNTVIRWTTAVDKRVLFTYLHNNSADKCFLKLNLPEGLDQVYSSFFKIKKKGKTPRENDFWKKIKPLRTPDFVINHKPNFYITAWAGVEHWKFFYNSNTKAFPNIQTVCTENKSLMVHRLPAFSRLFPRLNNTLHFAKFLN
jgi:hypothetical protein